MRTIIDVKPLEDCKLLLTFDNNVKRQGFLLMFLIREIQDIQSEYLLREICERSRNWRQKNYCHIPMAF